MTVINLRSRARQGRAPSFTTAAVGGILAAGVLAGCGTAAAPGAGGAGSTGEPASGAKATLTIEVKAGSAVTRWTLRCDPVGGTTPDPAAVCKTLFGAKHPFGPLNRHIMCPMILVSGKQIIVDGTWFGTRVHRVIIDGGCDLPFFNSLDKTFS